MRPESRHSAALAIALRSTHSVSGWDQAGVLGKGYELVGREQTMGRVLPTDESFDTLQVPSHQIQLGLVVDTRER